jgi:glycine/sarcosine N-methyltransferase
MELYRAIADHYDEIFPLDPAQADFVAARAAPGGAVLDSGCASGSLAYALAARGFRVTGIDRSQRLVAKAVRRGRPAEEVGEGFAPGCPRPEFRLMDMDLAGFEFPAASFDAVLCLGNTLPHLRGSAQIGHCLSGFRALLKESGVLIVQTIDFQKVAERGLGGLPTIDTQAIRFERSYLGLELGKAFDFSTRLWIKPAPDPIRGETRLYALSPGELDGLLSRSGFSSRQAFASFSGEPGPVPLLIVAARP